MIEEPLPVEMRNTVARPTLRHPLRFITTLTFEGHRESIATLRDRAAPGVPLEIA